MLNAVIIGAGGRMGRALVRAAAEISDRLRSQWRGGLHYQRLARQDVGELAGLARLHVRATDDLAAALEGADVVIDFSASPSTRSNLTVCRAARKPLLIGTTGFAADLSSLFEDAAWGHPIAGRAQHQRWRYPFRG